MIAVGGVAPAVAHDSDAWLYTHNSASGTTHVAPVVAASSMQLLDRPVHDALQKLRQSM